jgi:hypothetical protein
MLLVCRRRQLFPPKPQKARSSSKLEYVVCIVSIMRTQNLTILFLQFSPFIMTCMRAMSYLSKDFLWPTGSVHYRYQWLSGVCIIEL